MVMVPQGCHQCNLNHPGQHKRSFQDSSTSSALAAISSHFPTTNSIFLIVDLFFIFVLSMLFLGDHAGVSLRLLTCFLI